MIVIPDQKVVPRVPLVPALHTTTMIPTTALTKAITVTAIAQVIVIHELAVEAAVVPAAVTKGKHPKVKSMFPLYIYELIYI